MPYRMKTGKWRATRMINGRVRTRSFLTRAEAKKWEAEQTAEGWAEESSRIPSVCWLEFLSAWLSMAQERFSVKTWKEKRLAARTSLKIIPPDLAAECVTQAHALAVIRLGAKTSGNAANKLRKNLASAWSWGIQYYGLPEKNPFLRTAKFPADQTPRYVPPEGDFWKVYEAADDRDKVFLLFLLHTGARCGEAFRLVWDDVDLTGSRVRLGTRKTSDGGMRYAWVPMTAALRDAMAALRQTSPFGSVVFEQKKRGGAYTSRQHMMGGLCRAAGVPHFGFHAIRHLSATLLAYAGIDLPTIQHMLRHQSPTTTARYIKDLGINREKIEEVFNQKKGAKIHDFTPPSKAICT